MTGAIDIRRSLQTKTIDVARGRCLDAEKWFSTLIRQLRAMGEQPRSWPADHFDDALQALRRQHQLLLKPYPDPEGLRCAKIY